MNRDRLKSETVTLGRPCKNVQAPQKSVGSLKKKQLTENKMLPLSGDCSLAVQTAREGKGLLVPPLTISEGRSPSVRGGAI